MVFRFQVGTRSSHVEALRATDRELETQAVRIRISSVTPKSDRSLTKLEEEQELEIDSCSIVWGGGGLSRVEDSGALECEVTAN